MLGTGETRSEVYSVLAVVGTGSLSGEQTKSSPPCGASRAEREMFADGRSPFSFLFFLRVGARRTDVLLKLFFIFSGWRGLEARRPDTVLASDVRALAVPH